jgi:hypothetical protein
LLTQEYIFSFEYGDGRVSMDAQQKVKGAKKESMMNIADAHKVGGRDGHS